MLNRETHCDEDIKTKNIKRYKNLFYKVIINGNYEWL